MKLISSEIEWFGWFEFGFVRIWVAVIVIRCDDFRWFAAGFRLLVFVVGCSKFEWLMRCRMCGCSSSMISRCLTMWNRWVNIMQTGYWGVSCCFSCIVLSYLCRCLCFVCRLHGGVKVDSESEIDDVIKISLDPLYKKAYRAWCNCSSTCSTRCLAFPTMFVWLASSALRKVNFWFVIGLENLKFKWNLTSLPKPTVEHVPHSSVRC